MRKSSLAIVLVLAAACVGALLFARTKNDAMPLPSDARQFAPYGLETDTTLSSVSLSDVLSGGVRKDGIPALTEPAFVSLEETDVRDAVRGILVRRDGISRFYPYSILAWHEIVNDAVDGTPFAVTYCPLCDSGLVFDRSVRGKTLRFGVSGLLFESNLLMYDTETESLWSQSRRRAVVGDYTDTELTLLPFQVLRLSEVREKYPETAVLSADTGHLRNYKNEPYAGYTETEQTLFPISVTDRRYPAKDVFYVIPFRNRSLALHYREFPEGVTTFSVDEFTIAVTRDGDEITARHGSEILPGYYELWFSWAVHHQDDGIVLGE